MKSKSNLAPSLNCCHLDDCLRVIIQQLLSHLFLLHVTRQVSKALSRRLPVIENNIFLLRVTQAITPNKHENPILEDLLLNPVLNSGQVIALKCFLSHFY